MEFVVIGIGNPDRGDDAVGLAVVERLRGQTLPGRVRLATIGGDMLELLDVWESAATAVVVDAMMSSAAPGSVRCMDASARRLEVGKKTFVSTHAIGLPDAIELARGLGRIPSRLLVYGIEAACIDRGAPLTPAVAAAVDVVVEAVVAVAVAWAGGGDDPPSDARVEERGLSRASSPDSPA